MSSIFKPFVFVAGGRIWATYPLRQMVMPIVAWVTSGFVAPGVHPSRNELAKSPVHGLAFIEDGASLLKSRKALVK